MSSDSIALILLHGAGGNHAMWLPVQRHLDPRWQVSAIDLPGHGARSHERYTLAGARDAVAAAARSSGASRVVLSGDSLGGYSALVGASAVPREQLAGLVIGGCTQNMVGKSLRQLRLRSLMIKAMVPLFGEQRLVRKSMGKFLDKAGISAADGQAMADAHLRLRAFPEAVEALAHVDVLPQVRAIEAPILFVNGDRDPGPVAHEAEFVAAARRGSAHRFDCEHGVSIWRTKEFAGLINSFIEREVLGHG